SGRLARGLRRAAAGGNAARRLERSLATTRRAAPTPPPALDAAAGHRGGACAGRRAGLAATPGRCAAAGAGHATCRCNAAAGRSPQWRSHRHRATAGRVRPPGGAAALRPRRARGQWHGGGDGDAVRRPARRGRRGVDAARTPTGAAVAAVARTRRTAARVRRPGKHAPLAGRAGQAVPARAGPRRLSAPHMHDTELAMDTRLTTRNLLVLAACLAAATPAHAQSDRIKRAEDVNTASALQSLSDDRVTPPRRITTIRRESSRPVLGVVLMPDDGKGVRISAVTPGGGGAKAGLKPGDRITVIDGSTLQGSSGELRLRNARKLLSSRLEAGSPVRIGYVRDGKPASVDVTPQAGQGLYILQDDGSVTRAEGN